MHRVETSCSQVSEPHLKTQYAAPSALQTLPRLLVVLNIATKAKWLADHTRDREPQWNLSQVLMTSQSSGVEQGQFSVSRWLPHGLTKPLLTKIIFNWLSWRCHYGASRHLMFTDSSPCGSVYSLSGQNTSNRNESKASQQRPQKQLSLGGSEEGGRRRAVRSRSSVVGCLSAEWEDRLRQFLLHFSYTDVSPWPRMF